MLIYDFNGMAVNPLKYHISVRPFLREVKVLQIVGLVFTRYFLLIIAYLLIKYFIVDASSDKVYFISKFELGYIITPGPYMQNTIVSLILL